MPYLPYPRYATGGRFDWDGVHLLGVQGASKGSRRVMGHASGSFNILDILELYFTDFQSNS